MMSDESLLERADRKAEEVTPEASAMIESEVAGRGGLELLRQRVEDSGTRPHQTTAENLRFVKRLYPVVVLLAYGFYMYAIRASLWFYWLCLFALVASLFVVLFRPPFNPEDEIKELVSGMPADGGPGAPAAEPGADENADVS